MTSPVVKSHLQWTAPLSEEQVRKLPGSRQGFTAQMVDLPGDVFSVALVFPQSIADIQSQDVDLLLLAPDRIPDVVGGLRPGLRLRIFRGHKSVAECVITAVEQEAAATGSV